jgi:hypothetical protein
MRYPREVCHKSQRILPSGHCLGIRLLFKDLIPDLESTMRNWSSSRRPSMPSV